MEDSPIWADGSTEAYASELEEAMGGAARLAELTGSRAHLRQGAPQIMKVLCGGCSLSRHDYHRGLCARGQREGLLTRVVRWLLLGLT